MNTMGNNQPLNVTPLKVIPLYKQLKRRIENEIELGNWKPKEQIPSELELSQMFSVSRVTVRAAVNELSHEGILIKVHGKGTYVAGGKSKPLFIIDTPSFTEMCRDNGMIPTRKQLVKEIQKADKNDCIKLGVEKGSDIIILTRVLYGDGIPVMISEDRVLPQYKSIMAADMEQSSLNRIMLMDDKGIKEFITLERIIETCYATPDEANHLGIMPGETLLLLNDLTGNQNCQPFRRTKLLMVGDKTRVGYTYRPHKY